MLTGTRYMSQSWSTWIRFLPFHSVPWRSTLIIPSHLLLCHRRGLLVFSPNPRRLFCSSATCLAQLILLDLITRIKFVELEWPKLTEEDNIKRYFKNITGGRDWIIVVQDWKNVKTLMNFRVSQNKGNLLTSWGNISLSRKIISFGVI